MKQKKKGNSYEKKDAKAHLLDSMTHTLNTKDNVKNSLLETGKDIIVGVIGGGLVGAAIGKPSLVIGIGVTGAGHYMDNRLATLFGIGLMAANGFQPSKSVAGLDGMDMASIKSRMAAYKDSFIEKTYLDKVLHKKIAAASKDTTEGLGDLQFFNYPNDMNGTYRELDDELSALDSIEEQIEESGMAHMQTTGMNVGDLGEMGDLTIVDASDFIM
jgi:hypothetical protein